jgi:ADP-dependent NAD(P)H-hydrate dehydratase / NAD(P)H-hydrate epimerase
VYLVNAQQMREIDRFAMDQIGIPSIVLMETAGAQVVEEVRKRWPSGKVLVLAGHGNNGGDAFVVARHLANNGYDVHTWLVGNKERMTADCSITMHSYINSKHHFEELNEESWSQFATQIRVADLLIDGLLGTGLNRTVRDQTAKVIQLLNQEKQGHVISVDVPSGISADTGEVLGEAIAADLTVSFAYPKWGHYLFPGAANCGEVIVKDISIPGWVSKQFSLSAELLQADSIISLLPTRKRHSHKGTYGHVLIIGGSVEYIGAPALAAMGAMRAGSGMATMAIPQSIQSMVSGMITEAVYWPWPDKHGAFSADSWRKLAEREGRYNFTVIGPGIGQSTGAEWLRHLLQAVTGPLLLDADALNLLAQDTAMLKGKQQVILTPHPGEMARLLGVSTSEVERNRPQVAREFAMQHQVYLVLKGTYPIVATPEGKLFVSPRGSSSLAKAGSGDVLSGMIGALVNQTGSLEKGTVLAVYLHGMSGEFMDEYSGAASDLTKFIGRAIRVAQEAANQTL